MSAVSAISGSLGVVLGRGFRSDLYRELTVDVADGLTEATYPILSAIDRAGEPVSAATLAPVIGLDRSVVSRRASALIVSGLVAAETSPDDARQTHLVLTREGRRALEETRRRLHAAIERHLEDWSESDVALFSRLFARFTASPLTAESH